MIELLSDGKSGSSQTHIDRSRTTIAFTMPTSVRGWAVKRGAAIGITAQFLALVRILSEVFRIKYFDADRYTLALLEPFMGAALFTAVLVAVGVVAFAMARYRIALTIAVINVGALLVYKLLAV
jgi:hypothetical protein